MDEKDKNNIKLLIKIILYLLLALTFFSEFAANTEIINFIILLPFLFGILALICLYFGCCSNKHLNKVARAFGYVFAGSFILSLGWFIFNIMSPKKNLLSLLSPEKSTALWWALLIPAIILILYLIINELKKEFDNHLISKIKDH